MEYCIVCNVKKENTNIVKFTWRCLKKNIDIKLNLCEECDKCKDYSRVNAESLSQAIDRISDKIYSMKKLKSIRDTLGFKDDGVTDKNKNVVGRRVSDPGISNMFQWWNTKTRSE